MIVLCDASPLIFLAKLNRLALIPQLLGSDVVVLQCVVNEVLAAGQVQHPEQKRLAEWLQGIRVVESIDSDYQAGRLSASDRQTLTYAVRQRAAWLVADERLMRRIAAAEGVATIGTLGLLAAAARRGLISRQAALSDVNVAVAIHNFRISIALYQKFIAELDAH
jgi:predicted nucleic acid-binding protein